MRVQPNLANVRLQLLNLVVRKERPDLADLGEQLVEQQNGFKIKMKELEDNILYKLATAEGVTTTRFPSFGSIAVRLLHPVNDDVLNARVHYRFKHSLRRYQAAIQETGICIDLISSAQRCFSRVCLCTFQVTSRRTSNLSKDLRKQKE